MQLDNVIPWGRSYNEYLTMFELTAVDLQKTILGCSDGPASFNAKLSRRGGRIISVDPVYQFSAEQIENRIEAVYPEVLSQVTINQQDFIWDTIKNVADLAQLRMAAMQQFLADYDRGRQTGRYIAASLPDLPFTDQQFELALCSHFLFLYSDHVDLAQHIKAMKELCRVAGEVRVYPLVKLDNRQSQHLPAVIAALNNEGIDTSLQPVRYQFQKGATQMLVAKIL